ncbi:YaiI/YqxD family protein [Synergistaceae bacterium OttesenSCG-928-D05]|nr:YaiI/YqxD family protein [Synergistaceae bacterium OttesenSCG-928-D05]
MRILIDADGCPVVDLALAAAKKYELECIILCDTAHVFEKEGATTVTVSQGADSVDFKLVNMLKTGDIVVTQDYGLAAMCLARGAYPISQNGLIFDSSNIDSLLEARHMAKKIRRGGGRLKGPPKRTGDHDEKFARKLEFLILNCKSAVLTENAES